MAYFKSDISDRLKAYRLGKNIPVEQVADKLNISRAALYRYERGIPPSLETLEKMAEILDVSLPSLLGVGIEYISTSINFFERMRQIELETRHISVLFGPISYLLTTDNYDETLKQSLIESIPSNVETKESDLADIQEVMDLLWERKLNYRENRPNILSLMSALELSRFVRHGFIGKYDLPKNTLEQRKKASMIEVQNIIDLLEEQPIGTQLGLLVDSMPNTAFQIYRQPTKDILAVSPFKLGDFPNIRLGVAMITNAPEAIKLHSDTTSNLWNRSLKGYKAIDYIRSNIINL